MGSFEAPRVGVFSSFEMDIQIFFFFRIELNSMFILHLSGNQSIKNC